MQKNSVTKLGLLTIFLFIVFWTPPSWAQPVYAQPTPELIAVQSAEPQIPTNVGAGVVGAGGAGVFYYWVVAVYQGGSVTCSTPARVLNAPVPTAGGNYVQIAWTGVRGVGVTYNVLKTATPAFGGACAACLLAAGVGANVFLDNAGVAPGAYTLGPFLYPRAQGSISLNNRDSVRPALTLISPAPGTVTSPSEFDVTGTNGAYLDWSTYPDATIYGIRSRISSTFLGGTTLAIGGSFDVKSLAGAAPGNLMGIRGTVETAAGTVGNDILYGVYGRSIPSVGIIGGSSGVRGDMTITGAATAGLDAIMTGVKGDFDDSVGLSAATNVTAGVIGYIADHNTAGPDGAVVAMLAAGAVRQAANSPSSAFRVVDHNTTANVGFNYGFDSYYNEGGFATAFNVADIRGAAGDMLNNAVAGVWGVTRGAGNLTGVQLQAVAFANLTGWAAANGTLAYCNDCDPAIAGAGPTVCASAGTKTGTLAIRLNTAWTCLGI